MKLAVVTPFGVNSAIGRYAAVVGAALCEAGADVVVYRTDDPAVEQAQPYDGPVRPWRALLEAGRRAHDAVFYSIGNHHPYHHPVVALMPRVPGVGVFHDFYLYSLFCDWLVAGPGLAAHDRVVCEIYGPDALADNVKALDEAGQQALFAQRHPMTEWLARHAIGAIAHSSFYADRLRRACAGPVRVTPLAWPEPALDPGPPANGERVVVVTVGHMNQNKRAGSVIEAIGADPKLRSACEYRCVGPIEGGERERLTRLAERSGVRLVLAGRVSDDEMKRHLREADVVTCLRWPTLEGGSASLAEALMSARPVVVTDAGCYRDVPDDVVAKVDPNPDREHADLVAQLSRLAFDRPLRKRLGRRGREYALRAHSPAEYAQVMLALAREAVDLEPVTLLSHRLAGALSDIGARRGDPVVGRLGRAARELFPHSVAAEHDAKASPRKIVSLATKPVRAADAPRPPRDQARKRGRDPLVGPGAT